MGIVNVVSRIMFYKQLTDRYQYRDDSTRNLPSRWLWGTPPDVGHGLGGEETGMACGYVIPDPNSLQPDWYPHHPGCSS